MSSHKNRITKLENQTQPGATADEVKARARRWAANFDSDPNFAQAVKDRAREYPTADNLRRLRIVELLEIAAGRRAIA